MEVEHISQIPPLELPSREDRLHIATLCRIAGLKEVERIIIVKIFVEGDPIRAVSKEVKLSKSRVHQILHKTLDKLKSYIKN